MLEKIKEMLYGEEGLMVRIRDDHETMTEEEKETLLEFSVEVNRQIKEKKAGMSELLVCMDIIYIFMWYPETQEMGSKVYNNIMKGIDF